MSPKNKNKSGRPTLTNAQTDSESGSENLDKDADRAQALQALEAMFKRNLIEKSEYEARKTEINES
jgi:hypothetical protein